MSSPLALDADAMRRIGYRTVDMLIDRLTGAARAVVQTATPEELRERLSVPPPEGPSGFDEILAGLERDVLPYVARISHPGYLAFIPGEGTWPGALGDLIASALNLDTCWWLGASGPSALELVVLDWFRQWVGYPEGAAGVLVSGGSAANLTALACAREARVGAMDERAVVYMSDQTHSSVARAARALGFRPDQVRIIPSDRQARLRLDALRGAIAADRSAGREPLMVIANAGSTTAGAVDPLQELAPLCRDEGVWLHVDGAYGAFACLTERGRKALAGLELADSITLDPHKWLYQPVEVGALLVRDGSWLRRGFEIVPDFLEDIEATDREVNFSDLGLQLTRTARSLKLWISLHYFGVAAFRAAIDRCIDLALHAQERIESSQELELLSPASLGVVTFRRRPPDVDDEAVLERINADLAERIEQSGEVFISTGRVHGRFALRLCILNHSTDAERGRPGARAGRDTRGRRLTRALGARVGELPAARRGLARPLVARSRGATLDLALRRARRPGGGARPDRGPRAAELRGRGGRRAMAGEPRSLRGARRVSQDRGRRGGGSRARRRGLLRRGGRPGLGRRLRADSHCNRRHPRRRHGCSHSTGRSSTG